MVARKKAQAVPAETADTTENENLLGENTYTAQDLAPALSRLHEELGLGDEVETNVHVSIIEPEGESNVWRGSPDDYDLQHIAQQFGSGAYRVRVYSSNGEGRMPLRANRIFRWKLSAADERKRKADAEAAAVAAIPQVVPQQDIAGMMKEMMAGMQSMMMQVISAQPKEKDPLQTLAGIKELASIMIPRPEKQRGIAEIILEMNQLKQLQTVLTPEKLVDNEGLNANALLSKGIDLVQNAMSTAKAQQGATPQQTAVVQPIEQQQQMNEDELQMFELMMRMQLKAGVAHAKTNGDAKEYAESVYDLLPDSFDFAGMANNPQWLEQLAQLTPDVLNYREWFTAVRGHLLDFARQDGIELGDVSTTSPNPDNTAR